ncbi:hypothetical protein POM88_045967 [Heracleum sosnowskyi]|uniref:RNase H type-1 domain-containing protein n=1 Tax=Heracleum sosnowskyi TaxID=360622 RepID=A0AAD8H7I2_9APIA|nr:hypothetical protein POM88_045967 [Heracleum sosnowskyi]
MVVNWSVDYRASHYQVSCKGHSFAPETAEAVALLDGLQQCIMLDFTNLIMEWDCKSIIDKISAINASDSSLGSGDGYQRHQGYVRLFSSYFHQGYGGYCSHPCGSFKYRKFLIFIHVVIVRI